MWRANRLELGVNESENRGKKNKKEKKERKDELSVEIGGEVETGVEPTIGWGQTARPIF
mgnify:CR=1 FL=1